MKGEPANWRIVLIITGFRVHSRDPVPLITRLARVSSSGTVGLTLVLRSASASGSVVARGYIEYCSMKLCYKLEIEFW